MNRYHDRTASASPTQIVLEIRKYMFEQFTEGRPVRMQDFDPHNGKPVPCTNLEIKMAAASLKNLPRGSELTWEEAREEVLRHVFSVFES